jgi:hypothetical protein
MLVTNQAGAATFVWDFDVYDSSGIATGEKVVGTIDFIDNDNVEVQVVSAPDRASDLLGDDWAFDSSLQDTPFELVIDENSSNGFSLAYADAKFTRDSGNQELYFGGCGGYFAELYQGVPEVALATYTTELVDGVEVDTGIPVGDSIAKTNFRPFVELAEPTDASVFLPEIATEGGVFQFNITGLQAGVVYPFDPIVAVGYEYQIGEGDANFQSVVLPLIGDGIFDLLLYKDGEYVLADTVTFNSEYVFDDGGVDRFKILGIETTAGLDPTDVTAFVTGLSFVSNSSFTGTMTPITEEIGAVPVPASILMLGTAFFGFGVIARRKRSI